MPLLALIDLTTKEIKLEETKRDIVEQFLGGRGLNMHYLHELIKDKIPEPFPVENPLIFGTGLLTGSPAPNSSRMNISSISPESKTFVDSNCGGHFGARLKNAGFDNLIITGKAANPIYLYLENKNIEIRDASRYWGLDNNKAREEFSKLGDVEIAAIGPAGENLVRYASVMTGIKSAAGRGGLGAVMGSKSLKAIVVGGQFAKNYSKSAQEFFSVVLKSGASKALREYGTPFLYKVSNELGAIRTRNSQSNQFSENLNAENFKQYFIGNKGCYNCAIGCRHVNKFGGEGPEYTTIGLLGANLCIDNLEAIIKFNNLCNDFGLDTSSTGNYIGWIMELSERNMVKEKIDFGDALSVEKLIKEITRREGFGSILADGSRAPLLHPNEFDSSSLNYLIACKGLPQSDPHDPRIVKSFALGLALASRGMDHLRNRPTLNMFESLPDSLIEKIYGQRIERKINTFEDKHIMVKFHEDIYAVVDSLGICKFVCHSFNSPHLLNYEHFSKMIELFTPYRLGVEDLKKAGERIVNLEREINNLLGLSAKDDSLPRRYFEEPIKLGPYKGELIDREEFEKAKRLYYESRGWKF